MLKHKLFVFVLLFTFSLFLIQCAETEEVEESQDEHVCEHLMDGPAISLMTSPSFEAALTAYGNGDMDLIQAQLHTRYDLELAMDTLAQTYSGYAVYQPVSETGDYVLYADAAAGFQLYTSGDPTTVVVAESTSDHSEDCESILVKNIYELDADSLYVLEISHASLDVVGVLFPMLSDDAHEH